MKKAVYQLEPLTCPSCIKKIETTLGKIEGVDAVKVLFNSGKVRTEYDESLVEAEHIGDVMEGLGYPVITTKVS